jgi:hypothetical protein
MNGGNEALVTETDDENGLDVHNNMVSDQDNTKVTVGNVTHENDEENGNKADNNKVNDQDNTKLDGGKITQIIDDDEGTRAHNDMANGNVTLFIDQNQIKNKPMCWSVRNVYTALGHCCGMKCPLLTVHRRVYLRDPKLCMGF